ncbi:MAG: SH3 domain-containing protein [Bacteroidales bacterium]|nr:SH3 domain-containing protein [Bacteroidales bacterium]
MIYIIASGQEKCIVTATKLNVRKTPSSESNVIGTLSKGDTINIRVYKKSWAEIDFKKGIGYVSKKHITPIEIEHMIEPEPQIEIDKSQMTEPKEDSVLVSPKRNNWFSFLNNVDIRLTSSLSIGLSNLYSFDAYSHPRFGFGIDVGSQITASFMPERMFSELTLGYMSLGNSNYSFPSFSVNILPVGYRSDPFDLWKLQNARYYAVGGLSFQFSGGGIFFSHNSQYYSFYAKPTVNLYIKGGVEITDMIAVGFLYMHGFNNVCSNLSIGIKHSVFQIYGSFLFDKWKKQ